jgi:hypothetical protein
MLVLVCVCVCVCVYWFGSVKDVLEKREREKVRERDLRLTVNTNDSNPLVTLRKCALFEIGTEFTFITT